MHVLVNQQSAFGPRTGIGHYTHELLRHLRAGARDIRIDVFPHWIFGLFGGGAWLLLRLAELRQLRRMNRALIVTR